MAATKVKLGLSSSLKFKYLEGEIMFLISSLVDKILSMLRLIGQSEWLQRMIKKRKSCKRCSSASACLYIYIYIYILRRNTCKLYYSKDETSNKTKEFMFRGTDFIQTTIRKDSLVLWAKAWAMELPCLFTWEKEKL